MRAAIPTHLTDHQLLSEAQRLARCEREATAQLVAHLAEIDARQLHLGAGFSSLFTYCREVLGLSESAAYNRIEAARAAKRFPAILDALADASMNLTTVRLLARQLTVDNQQELLAAAAGRSKQEVEQLMAQRFPRPDVAASIRKLPVHQSIAAEASGPDAPAAGPAAAPSPRTAAPPSARRLFATPLAPDRYQIKFTASAATWEKLRLARDLLRHAVPSGDPAEIVDRALSSLIQDLMKKKCAAVQAPRKGSRPPAPGSRHVPAPVRRVVWARDKGRCAFIAPSGRRCGERAFLEFHHVLPYAEGGQATVENIQLRCRAHNGYEAMLFYGANALRRGEPLAAGHPVAAAGLDASGLAPQPQLEPVPAGARAALRVVPQDIAMTHRLRDGGEGLPQPVR